MRLHPPLVYQPRSREDHPNCARSNPIARVQTQWTSNEKLSQNLLLSSARHTSPAPNRDVGNSKCLVDFVVVIYIVRSIGTWGWEVRLPTSDFSTEFYEQPSKYRLCTLAAMPNIPFSINAYRYQVPKALKDIPTLISRACEIRVIHKLPRGQWRDEYIH